MKKRLVMLILSAFLVGAISSTEVLAKNNNVKAGSELKEITMEEKSISSEKNIEIRDLLESKVGALEVTEEISEEDNSMAEYARGNGWVQSGSYWYYYSNGRKYQNQWLQSHGAWYYLGNNGVMATGEKLIDGQYYYFNNNGTMQTGWVKRSNKWYYYNSSGAAQTGWIKSGNSWYCLNYNGEAVTGKWRVDGKIYYFDNNAIMQTGWVKISGIWHYYNSTGAAEKGWVKSGLAWYYINFDGSACTGGIYSINSSKYLFDSNGIMCTGWYENTRNGNIYYFNEGKTNTGAMATGTVYIEGVRFTFNSNGVLVGY